MRSPFSAALAAVLAAAPASAADFQVHGFAAQGFALSSGNNVIGDSLDGNPQYYELGLNGSIQTDHGLRMSAQEVVRRAGELDSGKLRLDYAFLDYQAIRRPDFDGGVRAGRVKNPFGLYNETRDVVFTRPGILLPSTYFETQGARSLLFASDGAQLYGGLSNGDHYTSVAVTRALDFDASEDDKRIFFAGAPLNGDLHFTDFLVGRLMHEWNSWRVAGSYLQANLAYRPAASDPVPVSGDIDFRLFMLSGDYDAEVWSLTAEYQLLQSKGNFGAPSDTASDAAYLQAEYRFSPQWSSMLRLDGSYTNRNDRSGDDCRDGYGAPADRHGCFTVGAGAGVQWRPDPHWGVWAEYHRFDGYSQVPTIENLGRAKEPHWDLFLVMAGYRF